MDEKKNVKNNGMDKKETHYPVMAPTINEDPPLAPRVIGRKLHRIRNIALWSTKLCLACRANLILKVLCRALMDVDSRN